MAEKGVESGHSPPAATPVTHAAGQRHPFWSAATGAAGTVPLVHQRLATHAGCRTLAEPDNRDYQPVGRSLAVALGGTSKSSPRCRAIRTGRGDSGSVTRRPAPQGRRSASRIRLQRPADLELSLQGSAGISCRRECRSEKNGPDTRPCKEAGESPRRSRCSGAIRLICSPRSP